MTYIQDFKETLDANVGKYNYAAMLLGSTYVSMKLAAKVNLIKWSMPLSKVGLASVHVFIIITADIAIEAKFGNAYKQSKARAIFWASAITLSNVSISRSYQKL